MKLYTYDPAPNPMRLKLFLQYKGIELDTQQVDLGKLEQHEDSYGAINPARTVPALVLDDGKLLTEVIGQCVYLEGLHPDKPLLGSTPLETAEVISWDHKIFLQGMAAIADIFRNGHPAFKDRAMPGPLKLPQIPELCERGKIRLEAFWPMIDEQLGKHPWVAGDHFSFADIDLFCLVQFAGWIKESIPEDCSNMQAWYPRAEKELGAT
ncbi:MAG: glutathione S-transferase family protein [Halieaceae bacterium]|jgi:glutathione S-transferase|nr:glutathione S-transferase family protein [Halieaceae bacterium]